MNKKIKLLITTALTVFALVGCTTDKENNNKESKGSYIVEHELGSTTLENIPERIAVLELSYVDALVALDKDVVAIAEDGDSSRIIEPVMKGIEDYISLGSRRTPSLEALMESAPDLIIADPLRHKDIQGQLEQIAPTIYVNSTSIGYDEILSSFEMVAESVGKREEGKKLVEEHKSKVESKKIDGSKLGKTAVGVVQDGMLAIQTDISYVMESLRPFGIENVTDSTDTRVQVTLEQLVDINPDTLIIMTDEKDSAAKEFKNSPLWNELSAVKNNKYFEVDRSLWFFSRGLISTETMVNELEDIIKNDY